jgi:DNA-binding transcriptional MerR regulator
LFLSLVSLKIDELKNLSVNLRGIKAIFSKNDDKFSRLIKSDKPINEKIKESQKIIDEAFKLGFQSAGGRYSNIWDVNIKRDNEGNVVNLEYKIN